MLSVERKRDPDPRRPGHAGRRAAAPLLAPDHRGRGNLADKDPTKFVRVLGENLVLFMDKSGNAGLIPDHCPHRGASLLYGRVEERGIPAPITAG